MNLGVLGGAGPLASARFVSDLYNESNELMVEQCRPNVVALHQSDFPDRTAALLAGREEVLVRELSEKLHRLRALGCSDIVVTCFTLHSVFERLEKRERNGLHDLLSVVEGQIGQRNRYLVLCTNGSRHSRLFDRMFSAHHPMGNDALVYPDPSDQTRIHNIIYELKLGEPPEKMWRQIAPIVACYAVDGIVAGCTEVYLCWPQLRQYCHKHNLHHVDALIEMRKRLLQL